MRLFIDANVLLDCLVLEKNGLPRPGKAASEEVLELCDQGVYGGLVSWHTLPILDYYYGQQHHPNETGAMMDGLLAVLKVPTVGHPEAIAWRTSGITDFEDTLQVIAALTGEADYIISRNVSDFEGSVVPVMTPEAFLAAQR